METWDWADLVPFCHAVARDHTGCPLLAEDAAQEAALRAWRFRDTCTAEDPRPWLATIARREVQRLGERQSRRGTVPLDDVPEPAADCAELELAPERDAIQRLLANFTEIDLLLLKLRYQDDLTQTAIASQLQMAESTVRVRLHRVRRRLHQALTDEAHGAR